LIASLALGAVAGYLAGLLVNGDDSLGGIAHIALGTVGAIVGGVLASLLFNARPINGPFDISAIVVATSGAVIAVLVVAAVMGIARSGRGAV